MKKIQLMFMALVAALTLAGCSVDNDAFLTAGEDDQPRILNTDLEEQSGGKPIKLANISRDANFKMEAIVTPVQYTTVTWFIDGEQVCEGNEIDQPVLAGDHSVRIVATTTKGKTTWRDCSLRVLPLPGDPAVDDGRSRHLVPGTAHTITGTALDRVARVYVGREECAEVMADGGRVQFTVPEMELGDYQLMVETADGVKYGCGLVTVSNEPYVEVETTLWSGEFAVTWGTPFNALQAKSKELVADGTLAVGKTLKVYVTGNGQGTAASAWWNNILTGEGDPNRGDTPISGDQVLEYKLNDTSIDLILNQDGLLVVGDGYTVTKVSVQ